MTVAETNQFRSICKRAGVAVTHQRQVIYETLRKAKIPSVSLATVYKNIHLLIESGVFSEVSPHHGSLRVETNARPHYHLVCTSCKSITDIDAEELGFASATRKLRGGFLAQRFSVDILGLCPACQK
jgi:Fur family transcriptional regulator, peroxide stress response regulator